jgi:hypothetical protein
MFTIGKWIVSEERSKSGWIDIRIDDEVYGLPVASTHGHFPETVEADARLIAASKDLYQTVLDLLPLAEKTYGLKDAKVAAIRAIIDQIGGAK